MQEKKYLVDLFSGCGGLSFGFEQAGFESVLGVDVDAPALKTFAKNHPHAKTLELDLSKDESVCEIVNALGDKKIEIIVAGPPCQGFSLTGTRQENDKRNKLFYSVFKLAERIKPTYIVIENVPGISTLYGGRARDAIYSEFERLGYRTTSQLLYAPDYGIPQIRRRKFFVGVKNDTPFVFPDPTHTQSEYITCEEAISDLPSLEDGIGDEVSLYEAFPLSDYQNEMREKSSELFNHVGTRHRPHVIEVIKQVPDGGNHKDLPPGVGTSRKFNEAWTRYHSKSPSKTIDTGHRNHFHYKWNRVPTVRENARLQSFPDHFVFLGTKTQQYKQVGNAVPPKWGYVLGKKILDDLNV